MKTEFSVVMCRVFNYYSNNWFALMPPFTHGLLLHNLQCAL